MGTYEDITKHTMYTTATLPITDKLTEFKDKIMVLKAFIESQTGGGNSAELQRLKVENEQLKALLAAKEGIETKADRLDMFNMDLPLSSEFIHDDDLVVTSKLPSYRQMVKDLRKLVHDLYVLIDGKSAKTIATEKTAEITAKKKLGKQLTGQPHLSYNIKFNAVIDTLGSENDIDKEFEVKKYFDALKTIFDLIEARKAKFNTIPLQDIYNSFVSSYQKLTDPTNRLEFEVEAFTEWYSQLQKALRGSFDKLATGGEKSFDHKGASKSFAELNNEYTAFKSEFVATFDRVNLGALSGPQKKNFLKEYDTVKSLVKYGSASNLYAYLTKTRTGSVVNNKEKFAQVLTPAGKDGTTGQQFYRLLDGFFKEIKGFKDAFESIIPKYVNGGLLKELILRSGEKQAIKDVALGIDLAKLEAGVDADKAKDIVTKVSAGDHLKMTTIAILGLRNNVEAVLSALDGDSDKVSKDPGTVSALTGLMELLKSYIDSYKSANEANPRKDKTHTKHPPGIKPLGSATSSTATTGGGSAGPPPPPPPPGGGGAPPPPPPAGF